MHELLIAVDAEDEIRVAEVDDERRLALGTRCGDRAVPQRVLAVRVAIAAVEDLPAPRDLLHELALTTEGLARDVDAELARVIPVVKGLAGQGVPISVDTTKAPVAEAAVAAGATIVNDVSGARHPGLLEAVARSEAAYVLMHTRGTPKDMQQRTDYDDVVAEVFEFLAAGLRHCERAGIDRARVLVDAGLGFAKTTGQNLRLLQALRQFRSLGRPVLVGASRKSFLGRILGADDPDERLEGSLACAALAAHWGAGVIRVHDVAATVRAVRTAHAVTVGRLPGADG